MTRQVLLAAALAVAGGCARLGGGFPCERSTECVDQGTRGTCEPTGFCSFPDPTCPSGDRYGAAAPGDLADQCTGDAVGPDADDGQADAPDGAPVGAIRVVGTSARAKLTSVDRFELARPPAAGPGTLLFVAAYSYFDFSVVEAPEGWTKLSDRADVDAWFHAWWFYRVVGARGDDAAYEFRISTDADCAAGLVAFEGVDLDQPFDATDDGIVTGSPFAAPSLDVQTPDATLVASYVVDEGADDAFNPPAGMEEKVDVGMVGIFVEPLAATGPTGQRVSVTTATETHTAGVAIVALRPAD